MVNDNHKADRAAWARALSILFVLLVPPFSAIAWASGERNPFDYTMLTYVWVMSLSAFGGIVNFSRKLREGKVRAINLTEFVGELVTSAFAGLLAFWLCEAAGIDKLVSAAMIAISGHMGSRAIFRIERWMEQRMAGQDAGTK